MDGLTRASTGSSSAPPPSAIPAFVREASACNPGKIAVGVDARDGLVAVDGWAKSSELTAVELGKRFEDAGVAAIIYTDISRDGAMKGLNIEATLALAEALVIPVIASGRPGLDRRHRAAAAARLRPPRRRHHRPRPLRWPARPAQALDLIKVAAAAAVNSTE